MITYFINEIVKHILVCGLVTKICHFINIFEGIKCYLDKGIEIVLIKTLYYPTQIIKSKIKI